MKSKTYTAPEVTSILGVVDTFLRWKNNKTKGNRTYTSYHPSEFGKCLRKAQYRRYVDMGLMEVEAEDLDSQKLRLFDKGHNMHLRWQKYFAEIGAIRGLWKCRNPLCTKVYGEEEKQGIFCPNVCTECGSAKFHYEEIRIIDEELNFRGHADIILDFSRIKDDGLEFKGVRSSFNIDHLPMTPVVVDMKTINQDSFKRLSAGAHLEYVIQLNIYMYELGCDYGLLIYENKNRSDIVAFKVKKDEAMIEDIKWQAIMLDKMTEGNRLPPPRPKSKADYECKYCEFAPHCHKCSIWSSDQFDEKRKNFYKGLL